MTLEGYAKADPPTWKMRPVEADVPELLVTLGYGKDGTTQTQTIGDLALIAFYYLLHIGEYTVKGKRKGNKQTKQTVQFKLEEAKSDSIKD